MLQAKQSEIPRDLYLNKRDIFNIKEKLDQLTWKADACQELSVRLWTQSHPENVLIYNEYANGKGGNDDFRLGITRPELMKILVKHGHNSAFQMDSTFGTNSSKVSANICLMLLPNAFIGNCKSGVAGYTVSCY